MLLLAMVFITAIKTINMIILEGIKRRFKKRKAQETILEHRIKRIKNQKKKTKCQKLIYVVQW